MKKAICYFSFALLSTTFFGQKTISLVDFGSIGDTVILAEDSGYIGIIDVGEAGEQITWDYDFLGDNSLDTVLFIDPSTVSGGNLGNSNIVVRSNIIDNYWNTNATNLSITAFGFEFDFSIIDTADSVRTIYVEFDPPMHHATLDMEYGDLNVSSAKGKYTMAYEDTFSFSATNQVYIDSVRVIDNASINDNINGYGYLILPNDTLGCLRQELKVEHEIDIEILTPLPIFGLTWVSPSQLGFPLPIPKIKEDYVRYWARRQNYPVLEFSQDSTGETTSTRFLYNIQDYIDGVQSDDIINVLVHPNPVSKTLNIRGDETFKSVVLKNNLGATVISELNTKRNKNLTIDVSNLANGVYLLEVDNSRKKIVIQH